jgi:hypothetical protein
MAVAIFDVATGLIERRLLQWKEFQPRGEVASALELLWRWERKTGQR